MGIYDGRDVKTEIGCVSSHGGGGYAPGSYWDDDVIICGGCGDRIEKPAPTGGIFVAKPGLWGKILFMFGKGEWRPTYPEWIPDFKPTEKIDGIPDVTVEITGVYEEIGILSTNPKPKSSD